MNLIVGKRYVNGDGTVREIVRFVERENALDPYHVEYRMFSVSGKAFEKLRSCSQRAFVKWAKEEVSHAT